ncbi:MAG: SPOR domain-containing protein, partial [Deltaproteobacteria bacterium]
MRDEHRFREKIELSLENRHVRAIAFAAVLFLGAAFALGVFVGKRLASRAAAPAPINDLEALDARTPAARAGTLPPPDTARVRDSVASPVPLPPAEPAAL